jgi:thiol-disulfide isomerase/thioredoxin
MFAIAFDRALLAVLIFAAGLGVYWFVNRVILARARGRRLGLESILPGVPAILYFSMPGCAPCKTVQRPAIDQLKARLGDRLQVIEVDASARPDLADYWGVLSLPTTFVIDSQGRPRAVNHGAVGAEKLFRQIQTVERKPVLQNVLRKFLWPKRMET